MNKTIKTIKILGVLSVMASAIGVASCSDNVDPELEPFITERTLAVKIDGADIPDRNLNLGAAPSSTKIDVVSNTRWTVEISDCVGGWCDVDVINGSGNDSFTITVLDNMKEKRDCYVTIYKADAEGNTETDGSIQIKVSQAVIDVRLSPSSLEPFAPEFNNRQKFNIVSNVAWTLSVSYDSEDATPFITIIPDSSTMTDNGDGTYSGNGAASFSIDVQNNRTAADRKAFINLKSSSSTANSVVITQLKSTYTFDVSPFESRVLPAEGGSIEFGVLSLSDWNVDTAADWIKFSQTSGQSSESRVTTTATILPNEWGVERSTEIRFNPTKDGYQEQSVTVTQRGYDLTFNVNRADDVGVVPESGATVAVELDSRFKWEISAPDWLHASLEVGNPSEQYQTVRVGVDSNATNDKRIGILKITPLQTEFPGGVTLDPLSLGIQPALVSITQFGGKEPVVSSPWLVDGYTQTSATIEFNYYSPISKIMTAGLQWRLYGVTDWITTDAESVSNSTEGRVSVSLDSLEPATKYEARGYVIDENGRMILGSVCYPFTTAGQRPKADDNPTPSN